MKNNHVKIVSVLLVVIMMFSVFSVFTVNAETEKLTAEEYEILKNARSTVIDLRGAFEKSVFSYCYYDIYDKAVERYATDEYDAFENNDIVVTKDQLLELVYEAIEGLSLFSPGCIDAYLEVYMDKKESGRIIKIDQNLYRLVYPGGKGGCFSRDYDSTVEGLLGYTANDDGTFSFYYSEIIQKDVLPLLSDDGVTFEDLYYIYKENNYMYEFDYKGYHILYDEIPMEFYIEVPECRVFNYRLVGGKIDYIDDKWADIDGFTPPEFFSHVPGTQIGDVNGDGAIDNKDVVILFRYVSATQKLNDEFGYDFNEDGEVDNKDVVSLFRYISQI